jgi:anti-anti-sigma regulatory factor
MRTVVRVFSGEYDLTSKSKLRAEFETLYTEPNLILDMRDVSYIDSIFATELLRLHKRRIEKGIGVVSIALSAFIVRRLFAILLFQTLFRLAATLDELLPRDGSTVVIQPGCRGNAPLQPRPATHAAAEAG